MCHNDENKECDFCDPKFAEILKRRFGKSEVWKAVVEYLGGDPDKEMEPEELFKNCSELCNFEFPEDLKAKIIALHEKKLQARLVVPPTT